MIFSSYQFIFLFLPITTLLFLVIGQVTRPIYAASFLILASLYFYGYWNPEYIPLLLFSIVFNYAVGMIMMKAGRRIGNKSYMKYSLMVGISVNLLLLGYYKYAFFFAQNISTVFGVNLPMDRVILPIGISFFTFTQISFLVDAYQNKAEPCNPIHYGLFVTFFPHLIAGPILHHKEMMPQFSKREIYRVNYENLAMGLTIFFIGLFKKVVFADMMTAGYVHPAFDGAIKGRPLGFSECWGGALAYTLQLYFDFSGYSDMAIGLARLVGIKLPINFHSPYQAVNITDFWRRWHMTLARFLRDYLYIPLGGNRKGPTRMRLNLMITMVLCGLWHGAGWAFILWGGLHGLYLVIHHTWQRLRRSLGFVATHGHWFSTGVARLLTFLCVIIGWVIFGTGDLKSAMVVLKGMAGVNGFSLGRMDWGMWASISLLLLIVWFCPNTQQIMSRFSPALSIPTVDQMSALWRRLRWYPNWKWALLCALTSAVGMARVIFSNVKEFLYFQF
jgi:alginate O-acetyltransferase complex protein AlgI